MQAGIPFGITRIGVHTGTAVIGNFGSRDALQLYRSGRRGEHRLAAGRAQQAFRHAHLRQRGDRALCNDDPLPAHRLGGAEGQDARRSRCGSRCTRAMRSDDFLERYGIAFARLERDAPDALALFDQLTQEAPDDPCVALHLDRLRRGDHGVTVVMTEK